MVALEEELAARGVIFDTGWNLLDGTRDWELDESLEGPLSAREVLAGLGGTGVHYRVQRDRAPKKRNGRSKYGAGDVLRIPLRAPGWFCFGRILGTKAAGWILVEVFRLAAQSDPTMDALRDADWIIKGYTTDEGIAQGSWKVIGHLPVEGVPSVPPFWVRDPLTGTLVLYEDPFHQVPRKTNEAEIRSLRAQHSGALGHGAVEIEATKKLREAGLL